ncbi:MAG TPA: DUF177 domain-containing protein [Chloroflexi bacterium]|nr:DUF177 domain-containing protein [Chloroflexota bacterium]
MIRFDVSALIKARLGASLVLDIDTGHQDLTDLSVDFLRGTVQAIRVENGLLVQGSLESQLGLACVRCLESVVLPFSFELEETFRLPGASPKPDILYQVDEDGWLNLTPLLREYAWVAIPMKPLCSPNCQGLCPQCGTNRNVEICWCDTSQIDPRLAMLKDLL